MFFDVIIAIRHAFWAPGALTNRYVMPNLLILLGIVVYTLAHVPTWKIVAEKGRASLCDAICTLGSVAAVLIIQSVVATQVGIEAGHATEQAGSYIDG